MKKIFSTSILLLLVFICFAQKEHDYKQAVGLKLNGGLALTYKNFIAENRNIEAEVTIWQHDGLLVSGLYEFNGNISKHAPGLKWFAGPGAHIGFLKDNRNESYKSNTDFGIDGIVGLDYKFKEFPLNVSLDWHPAFSLIGNNNLPWTGGLGMRYTF